MKNIGALDRTIRLAVAVAIGVAYAMGLISGTLAILSGVVVVVLLITSLTSTCPAYIPFGLSTRPGNR